MRQPREAEKSFKPMALIQCPDCGKQISDLASVCIHCGRPMAGQPATTEQEIKQDMTTAEHAKEVATAETPPTEPPRGTDPVALESSITTSNGIAAFCGLLIPGLAQLLQGQAGAAFVIFASSAICWGFVVANMGDRITGKLVAQPATYLALGIQFLGVILAAVRRDPKKQNAST